MIELSVWSDDCIGSTSAQIRRGQFAKEQLNLLLSPDIFPLPCNSVHPHSLHSLSGSSLYVAYPIPYNLQCRILAVYPKILYVGIAALNTDVGCLCTLAYTLNLWRRICNPKYLLADNFVLGVQMHQGGKFYHVSLIDLLKGVHSYTKIPPETSLRGPVLLWLPVNFTSIC